MHFSKSTAFLLLLLAIDASIVTILAQSTSVNWPTAVGKDITVDATILVDASKPYDCKMQRHVPNPSTLGNGSQKERQKAVFQLADGAILQNCIIGAQKGTQGSADGVHCKGSCTLKNVWFEDVGEDAVTFYGLSDSDTYLVDGGGAKNAADKIFQFDGKGTATIRNFWADTFARFARSCGNCANQYARHFVLQNVTALNGQQGQFIVGINTNFGGGDTAKLSAITIGGNVPACKRFIGVVGSQNEPKSMGVEKQADGKNCQYSASDIKRV